MFVGVWQRLFIGPSIFCRGSGWFFAGPVAAFFLVFKDGTEAEDDAVGIGEVADDLCQIEDFVVGEVGVAEGLDIVLNHGGGAGSEFFGVIDEGSFARVEFGVVACHDIGGDIFALFGEKSEEASAVVFEAVGAAVESTDGDGDHFAFGSRKGRGLVHGLNIEGAVCFE